MGTASTAPFACLARGRLLQDRRARAERGAGFYHGGKQALPAGGHRARAGWGVVLHCRLELLGMAREDHRGAAAEDFVHGCEPRGAEAGVVGGGGERQAVYRDDGGAGGGAEAPGAECAPRGAAPLGGARGGRGPVAEETAGRY